MSGATDPMLEIMRTAMVAEIGKNLNFESRLVSEIVSSVMNTKVNPDTGVSDKYGSYNTISYLEWLVRDCIREVAKTAAQDWVRENTATLGEEVKKALEENRVNLADSAAQSIVKALKTSLSCHVNLEFKKGESDDYGN